MKRSLFGGRNKLTDDIIGHLTRYYTAAIRRSRGSIKDLRKDILATFFHCSSSDEHPRHHFCPTGSNSWCFYNQARAVCGPPNTHEKMRVYFKLNQDERSLLFSIYKDLSTDELLHKCMASRTQNPNESLHSKLWNCLPKIKFFCLRTCQYSVTNTVLQHNYGYSTASMISDLGLQEGSHHTTKFFEEKDKKRKREASRTPRKKIRVKEDQDPSYASGAY
ncbi:hypothetical protein Pcinc_006334 [Petrolisthes cinctipes]|uniref:Uncharacterized protein n=1 Tax=Petrolisthes cinctipes TaxID=88211 RepID=A0AAE1GHQ9_PETCI|nr:hypothetical protein Pcinc_006334 [Petrolisthes cinctipes]